ncbi:DUF4031 domain-containing protein [Mycobacteroides chelonae]|uniref:DUF4031 domain-containing protein n=1 Tax=Mycobacteroides chelonae TaxID=1774 RepID=UPI000993082E|nr:DUF4031 domain-containing protein [Mycobacteroides chelonae]
MSVYVDNYRRRTCVDGIDANWSHLLADTDEELHRFAARLGMRRCWHQHAGRVTSHYDITDRRRQQAIELGAIEIGYLSAEARDLVRRKIAARQIDRNVA